MDVRQQFETLAQQKLDRTMLRPDLLGYGVPTFQSAADGINPLLERVPHHHLADVATKAQAASITLVRCFPSLEGKGTCRGLGARFVRALTRVGEQ
jgi:hypothetical protein